MSRNGNINTQSLNIHFQNGASRFTVWFLRLWGSSPPETTRWLIDLWVRCQFSVSPCWFTPHWTDSWIEFIINPLHIETKAADGEAANTLWCFVGWEQSLTTPTQSIVAVNKTSHYASLMSISWFVLVCLSSIDESIWFSSLFWSSCLLFWHEVSREAVHTGFMFTTQVTTNKVMKTFCDGVCVCVCSCLLSRVYTLQWDAATIKEPI